MTVNYGQGVEGEATMTQTAHTKAGPLEQEIERVLKRGILTRIGRGNERRQRMR